MIQLTSLDPPTERVRGGSVSDNWMYPDPNVGPIWKSYEKSLHKPYIVGIYGL